MAEVTLMGKWPWCCTYRGQESSNELNLEWICPVVAEIQCLQGYKSDYYARGHTHVALRGKWQCCCTSTDQDSSNELNLEWIRPVVAEFQCPQGFKYAYYTLRHAHMALMGKWSWCCTLRGQDGSNELNLVWIHPVVAEIQRLQGCDCAYYAQGHARVDPTGKWPWCCTSTSQDGSNELNCSESAQWLLRSRVRKVTRVAVMPVGIPM